LTTSVASIAYKNIISRSGEDSLENPRTAASQLSAPSRHPSRNFLLAVVIAILLRLALIFSIAPTTDVYYYDTQAAEVLLGGSSPYLHVFTGIPPRLLTTGASNVFAYFPFTAIFLVPFRVLGDVRLGFLLADLGVAFTLYYTRQRWSELSSLIYLYVPFTAVFSTIYLNNTLISIFFLALFFYFEKGGRVLLAATSLGLSLAAIQVVWIIFPLVVFYLLKANRLKELVIAILVATLLITPLALSDLNAFLFETLSFQFSRPVLSVVTLTGPLGWAFDSLLNINLNLSLNGFLLTMTGVALPLWLRTGALLSALPFFFKRTRGLSDLAYASGTFLLLSLFVLPNNFFLPYLEMPFFLLLAHFSKSFRDKQPNA